MRTEQIKRKKNLNATLHAVVCVREMDNWRSDVYHTKLIYILVKNRNKQINRNLFRFFIQIFRTQQQTKSDSYPMVFKLPFEMDFAVAGLD